MRKARLILAVVAGVSLLLNAVLAGVALQVWSRTDGGAPSAVFFALPDDLRQDLRAAMSEENGGLRDARAELSAAREALGSVLGGADPDIVELERALAQVRTSTERLQTELHAVILNHYLD
jgi:uncharacterized membrane protein